VFTLRGANGNIVLRLHSTLATAWFADVATGARHEGWVEAERVEGLPPASSSSPLRFYPDEQMDRATTVCRMMQARGVGTL
jgi:hypothetical protein